MKKKILGIVMLMCMVCASGMAQVVFTKFNLRAYTMYNWTEKVIQFKFKVTSEKDLKYVKVEWAGINKVGDAVGSEIVGAVNANVSRTKIKQVDCTGPFKSKKSYSRQAMPYYYTDKGVKAFPRAIYIDYMGGGSDTIYITKDNIKTFFPTVEWIDVDYNSGL